MHVKNSVEGNAPINVITAGTANKHRNGHRLLCVKMADAWANQLITSPCARDENTLFVCIASKAVHIKLVSELTTAGFIEALRRFIGRRGIPNTIWNDHGSDLVGAEREIRELWGKESYETVEDFCTLQNISWKFTSEIAPHLEVCGKPQLKALNPTLKETR